MTDSPEEITLSREVEKPKYVKFTPVERRYDINNEVVHDDNDAQRFRRNIINNFFA